MLRTLTVGLICLALVSCYHATVETGLPVGRTTVEDEWADSWLQGLVPPDDVEVAEECPNGVARVETRRSFLNLVAEAVTFGIYAPMHITVTCAARTAGAEDADEPDVATSATDASRRLETDGAVLIDLDG